MCPPFSVNITSVPKRIIAATACSPAWPGTAAAGRWSDAPAAGSDCAPVAPERAEEVIVIRTASRALRSVRHVKRWLREIALVLGVYGAYSLVRSALEGRAELAAKNARRIMSLERTL